MRRFIVSENHGYAIKPGAMVAGGSKLRTEVMVLDRGYCHRVVWSNWNPSGEPNHWTNRPASEARDYAYQLAAHLNAEDVAR